MKKKRRIIAELKADQRVLIALGINPKKTFVEPWPNVRPPNSRMVRLDKLPKNYRLRDGDIIHIGL